MRFGYNVMGVRECSIDNGIEHVAAGHKFYSGVV
jgi:hypothetical protein